MTAFKCINCDEVRDCEQGSSIIICGVCGFKMFAVPYDRKTVLNEEIKGFLKHLQINSVDAGDINFYRLVQKPGETHDEAKAPEYQVISKSKDDQRFPDIKMIQDYVCSSQKTEVFFERLNTSLTQMRQHVRTPFFTEYQVNLDNLKTRAAKLDEVLIHVLSDLEIQVLIPTLVLPEFGLSYSEVPDGGLLILADRLLDSLEALSEKILKFIKQYNMYGTACQKKFKITFAITDAHDYAADLADCTKKVLHVLDKKYVIDILSDGADELDEMFSVLWNALAAVRTVPVLTKSYHYQFLNGESVSGDEIFEHLAGLIRGRYAAMDAIVLADGFLVEHNEEHLFDLYNKMIERDTFGFMGLNKDALFRSGESETKLNALIGLTSIKDSIKKIKAYTLSNKDSDDLNIHMCFYGNPGTGKTEVARIIAGILHENKVLPSRKVVEVDRGGLVGQYVGETPQKTSEKIRKAMGGVLFVDEAYALIPGDGGAWDYGQEAVATLVKAMEDYRGKFCVILAGYRNQMQEMLASNPGFRSRIQFELDFPNYSRDELRQITELMAQTRKYTISDAAMKKILDISDLKRKEPDFANAREIRNILDQVVMCQNLRSIGSDDRELGIIDVNRYIQDSRIRLPANRDAQEWKILTADEELEQLIGLASVKRMIKKIKAYAKRNMGAADFNLHMCFYGNPGTGKTEAARILSRILHESGVLPEAKLIETDSHGLMGRYVGETGPKTKAIIQEAMGGVLFIDEAYGLVGSTSADGISAGYGAEAIEVLLKEMEDRRGQFCVILAGYQDETAALLNANPGLQSRIQFTLEFQDYTREELRDIALFFLDKMNYTIEMNALERILDITEHFRRGLNFANARSIRNILTQVIMNQNLRTEDLGKDNSIIIEDVEDYLNDESINLSVQAKHQRKIGF